jgi:hypothetical protein
MRFVRAILLGGMIAGALDIIYAFIHYGIVYGATPIRILHAVAAGLLGPDAASAGGWSTAALGLGLHFLMTIIMAAVFVFAASRLPLLTRFAWITGPLYGLALYFVMNLIVVPLSQATSNGLPVGQFLIGGLLIHAFGVGLPIALAARRARLPSSL